MSKKKSKYTTRPLKHQIEVTRDAPATDEELAGSASHRWQENAIELDREDLDIDSYVKPFLDAFHDGLALGKIDLTTQEGAREAIKDMDEKLQTLQKKAKIARSLRQILVAKKMQ